MRADVDLPWYWGFAARTLAGDSGLRSPLGGQLEAIRTGLHAAEHCVDSSRATDDMLRRIDTGRTGCTVAARLGQLTHVHQAALKLHYDPHMTLPYSVDACATLLALSRALTAPDAPDMLTLRKALQGATAARREAIAQQATALVRSAKDAYEATEVVEGRRVQVDDPREWRRA